MIRNYIKLALKVLARRKFFTFISLFGIVLTLVVLMVGTAILDNAFSPRAPETRLERALVVYTIGIYGDRGGMTGGPGYKFVDKYVRGLKDAEAVSVFSNFERAVMYRNGQKIETRVKHTDGPYWQILDHKFVEGGPYTQADDDNANYVAVITTDMREKLFSGKPALGKTIELDGQRFKIVGVVESVPFIRFAAFSEIWVPTGTQKDPKYKNQMGGGFNALVLARNRDDFPKLRTEFRNRLTHFVFDDPKTQNRVVAGLDTPFEAFARTFFANDSKLENRRVFMMRMIFVIAGLLFILLPTMNLVSINLSRIMERASEIGVRKAFGASSRTLIGQFVVENVVLTLIGGILGFILAAIALRAFSGTELLPNDRIDLNLPVFLYGMLIAAFFGIVSGVYPAWRMSRMHVVNALRGGAV
jgi:putative ABC transport system permease protein